VEIWSRFTAAMVILGLAACAVESGNNFLTDCNLPNEQASTISGRWPALPIPIALHSGGGFGDFEISQITSGAQTWNNFHVATRDLPLMDYGSAGDVRTSSQDIPQSVCANQIYQNGAYTGSVVIYTRGNWPYSDQIVALTSFCTIQDTPYNTIFTAILELNFENFFVDGQQQPDLQSISLHELGHLIGLNHSCEVGSVQDGMPDCNSGATSSMLEAVMFPRVLFPDGQNGEVRRVLNDNDQGRANCLYEDFVTASVWQQLQF